MGGIRILTGGAAHNQPMMGNGRRAAGKRTGARFRNALARKGYSVRNDVCRLTEYLDRAARGRLTLVDRLGVKMSIDGLAHSMPGSLRSLDVEAINTLNSTSSDTHYHKLVSELARVVTGDASASTACVREAVQAEEADTAMAIFVSDDEDESDELCARRDCLTTA